MLHLPKKLARSLNAQRRSRPVLFWFRVATVIGVSIFIVTKRSFWTPDTLFIVLFALFIVLGQARAFFIRFAPFLLLLAVYDSFRAIADDLNQIVHFTEMIHFDQWLIGGALPTAVLQNWWWHGHVQWYDFYYYAIYMAHFVVPVVLAIIIWKVRDQLYWPYVASLVLLSFGAFITYVVFPAAPPWMASDLGFITPIHRISSDIWYAMGVQDFSSLYKQLSPNAVAAVPSLHSAYPLLILLWCAALWGWRRVWPLAIYPVTMWIGVVYMGEHYIIDAILGALYAAAAFYGVRWWVKRHPDWSEDWQGEYVRGFTLGVEWVQRRVK